MGGTLYDLTPQERAGSFDAFRWATRTGSYKNGHPRAGTPHYGVVSVSEIRFRAPIFTGPSEASADNPLFRLVTDMQRRF